MTHEVRRVMSPGLWGDGFGAFRRRRSSLIEKRNRRKPQQRGARPYGFLGVEQDRRRGPRHPAFRPCVEDRDRRPLRGAPAGNARLRRSRRAHGNRFERSCSAGPAAETLPDFGTELPKASVAGGQKVAERCQQCHDLSKGGPDKIGPNLWGVVGRARASRASFSYSSAMMASHDPWTYEKLFAYLKSPACHGAGHEDELRRPEERAGSHQSDRLFAHAGGHACPDPGARASQGLLRQRQPLPHPQLLVHRRRSKPPPRPAPTSPMPISPTAKRSAHAASNATIWRRAVPT